MKPFDLELAKAKRPVCTRDGRDARIICFDRIYSRYPIVALVFDGIKEQALNYTLDGFNEVDGKKDLMMKSVKQEGWINIYRDPDTTLPSPYQGYAVYFSEDEARKNVNPNLVHVATVKIEWEE